MYSISPKAKFSYNVAKGSPEFRRYKANKLNEDFFERVRYMIEDNKINVSDFEQGFHSVMPEEVDVRIKKHRLTLFSNCGGASAYVIDGDKNILGQTIEIPTGCKKIKSKNLAIAFHESRHVIDTLYNPKYEGRTIAMEKEGLFTKAYNKLYERALYSYEDCRTSEEKAKRLGKIKKKILKFLKGKPVEHQVNYIQDMRYSLETENNAYGDTAKFAHKLFSQDCHVRIDDMIDERRTFMFKEKLALLKQIGFDIIKAERERLAQRSH